MRNQPNGRRPPLDDNAFAGRIDKDGVLRLADDDKARYWAWLAANPGTDVEVVLTTVKNLRSLRANRYYFGVVIKALCEHTGYKSHEMHEILAMRFLRIDDDPATGAKRRRRTPREDTAEFKEYVDQCVRFAMDEFELYIPPADVRKRRR